MPIAEYFGDWGRVLDLREAERVTKRLLQDRRPVCPNMRDLFRAFRLCDYNSLRVVIMGQDPYPQQGRATGIAFANPKGTLEENYSPSLKVLMESVIDFSIPHNRINFDPTLEKWEGQGVLMLNSALSCIINRTGSHGLLWRPFIGSLLKGLSFDRTGLVYVLMGNTAQSFRACVDSGFNHIISVPHPSYFARTGQVMPHHIWHDINKILVGQNGYGIEWYEEEDYGEQENQERHPFGV